MNIGKAIKIELAKRGIKQNEFAESIVVTNSYLSLICNGHITPTIQKIQTIALTLNMKVSELIANAEEL